MFDLGFWELLFVGIIALIVLGPERLPVAARTVGRWVGQARAYARSLSSELDREVHIKEVREQVRSAETQIRSGFQSASEEVRSLAKTDPEPEPAPKDGSATAEPAAIDTQPVAETPAPSDDDASQRTDPPAGRR